MQLIGFWCGELLEENFLQERSGIIIRSAFFIEIPESQSDSDTKYV